MSAIEILGLDHVVLRVRSLDGALRFYCEALGCSIERRVDELGLIQLRAGTALIDLVPIDSPLGRAGGSAPRGFGSGVVTGLKGKCFIILLMFVAVFILVSPVQGCMRFPNIGLLIYSQNLIRANQMPMHNVA